MKFQIKLIDMKRLFLLFVIGFAAVSAYAQEFNRIPRAWKWIGSNEVAFTYDGTYEDEGAFSVNARSLKRTDGIKAPAKYGDFPVKPEGAVNLTYSPVKGPEGNIEFLGHLSLRPVASKSFTTRGVAVEAHEALKG